MFSQYSRTPGHIGCEIHPAFAAVWNLGQAAMLDPVILRRLLSLNGGCYSAAPSEEALTNHVPAVAVIRGGQALLNNTGCKRCVGCRRPAGLNFRGEGCILTRVFTDDDFEKTLDGHGNPPAIFDAEALKCGEQMGLETPLVHTLNYERSSTWGQQSQD